MPSVKRLARSRRHFALRTDMPSQTWNNRIMNLGDARLDELVANPLNWRIHPEAQRQAVKDSLEEDGVWKPLLIQHGTDMVIDGHLRISIAMQEGQTTFPAVWLDVDDDEANRILALSDTLPNLAITSREKYLELIESMPKPKSPALMAVIAQTYQDQKAIANEQYAATERQEQSEPRVQTCPHCGATF